MSKAGFQPTDPFPVHSLVEVDAPMIDMIERADGRFYPSDMIEGTDGIFRTPADHSAYKEATWSEAQRLAQAALTAVAAPDETNPAGYADAPTSRVGGFRGLLAGLWGRRQRP